MTIAATLTALETSVDQVSGLRVKTSGGAANPPAAVIELEQVIAPTSQSNTADYRVRVLLLVQLGDLRNALDRLFALIEPSGTVSTSVVVALLSNQQVGQVVFEGPGLVEYGGQTYGGGVLTVEVFD